MGQVSTGFVEFDEFSNVVIADRLKIRKPD